MKKMFIISVIVLVLVGMVLGCTAPASEPTPAPSPGTTPTPAPPKVYEWSASTFAPPGSGIYDPGVLTLAKMIEQNTDGRVKIAFQPGGATVPVPELMNAVRDGVLQFSHGSPGHYRGAINALQVVDGLPFSWRNADETLELFWDYGFEDLYRSAYEDFGTPLLTFMCEAGAGLGICTKKPVKSLVVVSDCQSLKK